MNNKDIDYCNYYDFLNSCMSQNNTEYITNLIQAQLLDDMIDNFTDIMKDVVADLPMMEGKEYHDEKVKLDTYIEIIRDIKDTWQIKYNNIIALKDDDSEVDQVKEHIEKNKTKTCETCVYFLNNIGYCQLTKQRCIGSYSCSKYIKRCEDE